MKKLLFVTLILSFMVLHCTDVEAQKKEDKKEVEAAYNAAQKLLKKKKYVEAWQAVNDGIKKYKDWRFKDLKGDMYVNGWHVKQDYAAGLEIYLTIVDKSPDIANDVGQIYFNGNGCEPDKQKAFIYFKKAADKGHDKGLYNVALYHQNGWGGVELNIKLAIAYFEKSEAAGFVEARVNIGKIAYQQGKFEEAVKHFETAAKKKNANAHYNLAVLRFQGREIPMDRPKALENFEAAAELGHAPSMYFSGIIHNGGLGGGPQPQKELIKPKKAFEWFLKGANAGVVESAFMTGMMYIEGKGVDKNKEEGLKWLRKAAAAGHKKAKTAIKQNS